MAPAHIPMFLSQKPSTENGVNRPAILFLAWTPCSAHQEHRNIRHRRLASPGQWGFGTGRPIRLAFFREGAEVIKLHLEGSVTIPKPGLKGYKCGNTKNSSSTEPAGWKKQVSLPVILRFSPFPPKRSLLLCCGFRTHPRRPEKASHATSPA